MNIHLQHLATLEDAGAHFFSDIRRLDREALVGALGFHLEGFDALLLNQAIHILRRRPADLLQIRRALHGRTDAGDAEHLADLANNILLRDALVGPHKDQSLFSSDLDGSQSLDKLAYPLYQQLFKIWLVLPL